MFVEIVELTNIFYETFLGKSYVIQNTLSLKIRYQNAEKSHLKNNVDNLSFTSFLSHHHIEIHNMTQVYYSCAIYMYLYI